MTFFVFPPSDSQLVRLARSYAEAHLADLYDWALSEHGPSKARGYADAELPESVDLPKLHRDAALGLLLDAINAGNMELGTRQRGGVSACCPTAATAASLLFMAEHAEKAIAHLGDKLCPSVTGFRPWTADEIRDGAVALACRLKGEEP